MLKLGLTGGIGAGKSTVARRLAERGALVVDADRLAREVVEPGTEGLVEVAATFGAGVLTADGRLDRAALGRLVFADDLARARLNAILHPRIGALTALRMGAAGPDVIVVHDVPLLVENRMGAAYHLVIVVHAGAEERLRRLTAERGMPERDAAARMAAQADDGARRAAADVWLDNSGTRAELVERVDRLWDDRLAPYAENLRLRRPAGPAAGPATEPPAGPVRVDAATLARVRARLLHVAGPDAEVSGDGPELCLEVRDGAAVEALREPLDEAGFVRVGDAVPGGRLHRAADPVVPVVLHVRPAPSR
jgi:dephospho-CoA kinase